MLAFGIGPASAHTFGAGAGTYEQFIEGSLVVLAYPETLLPLLALGLLVSLWDSEGWPKVWPLFLAGLVAGFFLASVVGPSVVTVLGAAGAMVAAIGALLPRHHRYEASGFALGIGILAMAASLEGHTLFELSAAIYVGIFFGANLAVAGAAMVSRLVLESAEAMWTRIVLRVACSWIAAILVLMLAFSLASSPA